MKPVNQQKKKQPIRDQLFIVNKSAGRLRLMLFVLLYLIYWTFIAQTEIALLSISGNFPALFPEPSNFISGIIRDIMLRYFSPSTILFTIIPLVLFLSIRKMISRYLHLLFPSIGLKESEQYLNNCAFSSLTRNFHIHEDIQTQPQKNQEHLNFLGGPADFTFDSSSAIIVQNINNHKYLLISSDCQSTTGNFHLSHGDKIYAVISKNNRKVLLKNLKIQDNYGRAIDFNLISLLFVFNTPQKKSAPFLSRKTTMHDARLLSYLGGVSSNIVHQFLRDETQNFLHKNASIMFNGEPISSSINQAHEKFPDVVPTNLHSNYSEYEPLLSKKSRRVSRKHKHSIYIFMKKIHVVSFDKKDNKKKLILQLSNHLNEQLKSFFHISTIQISIIEMRKITING